MKTLTSIFGVLTAAGGTWGVFHEDWDFAPELVLNDVSTRQQSCFLDPGFTQFQVQAQNGTLPNYSFLTPSLNNNSQHPSDDIRDGECVMANIYEIIRNSPCWEKTLFIITYDEHGGFYDSIPTPTGVPNPDGLNWDASSPPDYYYQCPAFSFDRLGVRVPALLISPYIQAGVDPTQYEHSSIPATVLELFGLTWPVNNLRINGPNKVNTFTSAIGSTLRKDVPPTLPRPAADVVPLPPPTLPDEVPPTP